MFILNKDTSYERFVMLQLMLKEYKYYKILCSKESIAVKQTNQPTQKKSLKDKKEKVKCNFVI